MESVTWLPNAQRWVHPSSPSNVPGSAGTTASVTFWSFDRERGPAHLVAHGDDGRIGERATLPVRAVDHEGVARHEPRVWRREERRGPAELLHLTHAQRGLARVLVVRALEVRLDVGGHVGVGEEAGDE